MLVDGTFASPYHTRALDYDGVDVAIQSATKYLGGHSDLIAGSTSTRDAECAHRIAKTQKLLGNPLGPLESFLLARGLRTLDVRMQRHGENALRVARALEAHPKVAATYFPGLPSHPDHELAKELFPESVGPTSMTRGPWGGPDTPCRTTRSAASRLASSCACVLTYEIIALSRLLS